MAISFSTQATSNTGKSTGVLSPKSNMTPYQGSYAQKLPTQTTNMSKPELGTNPGVITPSYTHTTTTNQTGGVSAKPTPNPSVLAQQKALNAKGAGLVEDGIAGPKTAEAITKFSNTPSNQTVTSDTTTSKLPETPQKPVSSTNPSEQIQNVGQAGQQTGNEAKTQKELEEAGGMTQWEQDVKSGMAVEEANKRLTDFRTKVAQKYADIESQAIPVEFQQGREGALARQFASQEAALQSGVTNALTAQGQQFNAAGTQAARGATTAGQAYTGAQTQAQRGLGAQQTVLNAGLLQPTTIGQVPFSAVTGEQQGMIGGAGGLSQLGALQGQQQQGSQTQAMIGAYNQAKPLIETAKQQIKSAGFNVSPLALVNQLNQYVNKNVIPSGEYANIFNTLSEIATTISPVLGAQGAQTDLKTMISQEFIPKLMQGQDLASVFDNIEKNALAKIEANKATAQGTPLAIPTSGSSTGGSIWNF